MVSRDSNYTPPFLSDNLGLIYIGLFVLLANTNAVYSGSILQNIHPFTFLFWSFVITAGVFGARLILTDGRNALTIVGASRGALFLVNVTSACNWIGYFYALRYIEPAIVAAIMTGVGPLSTIVLELFVQKRRLPRATIVAALGILAGTAILVWASASGMSGLRETSTADSIVGLTSAILGGVFQALTIIATKRLGNRGWNVGQIMAHRFYLLIAVAGVLAYYGPGFAIANSTEVTQLAIATILGVIVPLLVLQKGILLLEPFLVAAMLSLGPVVTYLVQGLDARVQWSPISAFGCVTVAIFTIICMRMKLDTQSKQ